MAHDSNVSTGTRKHPRGAGAPRTIRTGEAGQPTLLVQTTTVFDWVWSDLGSGADMDATIWRPRPSDTSFFIIGDYAQGNYTAPVGASLVVKAINDDPNNPLIRTPKDFRQVWTDKDSGGDYDGSIWYPVTDDNNYIAVGFVGQAGYDKPSIKNFALLRRDLLDVTDAGALIYSDKGSDADDDVSLYQIVDVPNAFVAQGNYLPYSGTAYKLKNFS